MDKKISAPALIEIIQKSELDQTIKDILVRDIQNEGVNEFLLEQVIAYCDNAIEAIKKIRDEKSKNFKSSNPA